MAANSVFITVSLRNKFSKAGAQITGSVGKMRQGFRGLGRDADASGRAIKRSQNNITALGKLKGVLGTAAVIGGGRAALRSFATLETATLNVLSLVTKADDKIRLKGVFESMIQDAGKLGFSVDEAGKALFDQVSQAGFGANSLANYRGGMELAIGGNAQFADSITVINKLLENFPELAGDAKRAGSFLFTGQVFGSTNVAELARTLPEAAGIVSAVGVTAAQLITSVSLSTKRLGGTASAGIAFQSFIDSFSKVTKGSDQFKALKRLGLPKNAVEFEQVGLEEVLRILSVKRKGNQRERLDVSQAFTETRAKRFLNVIDQQFLGQFDQVLRDMDSNFKKGVGLQASYLALADSMGNSMSSTSQSIDRIMQMLGAQLAPTMKGFADGLENLIIRTDKRGGGLRSFAAETASTFGSEMADVMRIRKRAIVRTLLPEFAENLIGLRKSGELSGQEKFQNRFNSVLSGTATPNAKLDIAVSASGGSSVDSIGITSEGLDTGVQRGN